MLYSQLYCWHKSSKQDCSLLTCQRTERVTNNIYVHLHPPTARGRQRQCTVIVIPLLVAVVVVEVVLLCLARDTHNLHNRRKCEGTKRAMQ